MIIKHRPPNIRFKIGSSNLVPSMGTLPTFSKLSFKSMMMLLFDNGYKVGDTILIVPVRRKYVISPAARRARFKCVIGVLSALGTLWDGFPTLNGRGGRTFRNELHIRKYQDEDLFEIRKV